MPAEDVEPFEYNYVNNLEGDKNLTRLPLRNVKISGNIFGRTLPLVDKFSDYGFGMVWDREHILDSHYIDPVMNENTFNVVGINVGAPTVNLEVSGNTFSSIGNTGVRVWVKKGVEHRNMKIVDNLFEDTRFPITILGRGITKSKTKIKVDNTYNLDPYNKYPSTREVRIPQKGLVSII